MKYLTHDLIPAKNKKYEQSYVDHKCIICGIILYITNSKSKDGGIFVLIENDEISSSLPCTLTCEEYMIKSIIE
jgi:hypothetical protein